MAYPPVRNSATTNPKVPTSEPAAAKSFALSGMGGLSHTAHRFPNEATVINEFETEVLLPALGCVEVSLVKGAESGNHSRCMKLTLITLATLTASIAFAGETKIFNGTDLTGWEGNEKLWSVQDGAITGKTSNEGDAKIKHNTFLVWKGGTVSDFELTFKYRIEKGNSGVQYRSKLSTPGENGPIVSGYQADFEAGNTYSGILYEERGRGILAQRGQKTKIGTDEDGKKPKVEVTGSVGDSKEIQAAIKSEDWNEYKIVAKGNHLQHFINGKASADVTDEHSGAASEGILALQIHAGPAMVVQFKDLILKTEK